MTFSEAVRIKADMSLVKYIGLRRIKSDEAILKNKDMTLSEVTRVRLTCKRLPKMKNRAVYLMLLGVLAVMLNAVYMHSIAVYIIGFLEIAYTSIVRSNWHVAQNELLKYHVTIDDLIDCDKSKEKIR